jgi:hypothetical protein
VTENAGLVTGSSEILRSLEHAALSTRFFVTITESRFTFTLHLPPAITSH